MATAGMPLEEVVGWGQSRCRQQGVDRLAGLFGELELDRSACLLLADRSPVDGVAVWRNVSTLRLTTSQPRSLLSIAVLKSAKSRFRSAICRRVRMAQTCFGCNGGLAPVSFPLRGDLGLLPASA